MLYETEDGARIACIRVCFRYNDKKIKEKNPKNVIKITEKVNEKDFFFFYIINL